MFFFFKNHHYSQQTSAVSAGVTAKTQGLSLKVEAEPEFRSSLVMLDKLFLNRPERFPLSCGSYSEHEMRNTCGERERTLKEDYGNLVHRLPFPLALELRRTSTSQ